VARLTLTEPARTLWRKVRDTIRTALTDPRTNDRCYELGGGSILAARWGHRASFDIDLTTTDPKGILQETVRTQQGLAGSLCGELTPRSNPRHVTIVMGEGQRVDITVTRPFLDGQQQNVELDGRTETVLTTVQILHGKLNRAQESPARDVHDFITAAERDPRSLEAAVRPLTEREVTGIRTLWGVQNVRLENEAKERILDTKGTPVRGTERLGIRGGDVLAAAWGHSQQLGTGARQPARRDGTT